MAKYRIVYDPEREVYWVQQPMIESLGLFWQNRHSRSYYTTLSRAEEAVSYYQSLDAKRAMKKVVVREYS